MLIETLAELGWRQKLIARSGEQLAARCSGVDGLEVVEVSGNVIAAARAAGDVGVVNVHEGRAIQAAALNKFWHGVPYIVTRRVQIGPKHDWITRKMYREAARVVILSDAIHRSMMALDPGLECWIIPDASTRLTVDRAKAAALRNEFGARFVAGHIGELDDSHKGQLQIIDVARHSLDDSPGTVFVLVGSGRDEAMLREAAAGLPNVIFAGQVDNVGDYLAAFDVFLYPSRHEGLGSTMLDALACGLPVVATRAGGIPEVIEDGQNGFLVAVDDIEGMRSALQALGSSEALRRDIGARNILKAKKYSPERMARRYADVYEQIINSQN